MVVDPRQLDLELLGIEGDGTEDPDAAGIGDGGDDIAAVGEGEYGELDAESVADLCVHGCISCERVSGQSVRCGNGRDIVRRYIESRGWQTDQRGDAPQCEIVGHGGWVEALL